MLFSYHFIPTLIKSYPVKPYLVKLYLVKKFLFWSIQKKMDISFSEGKKIESNVPGRVINSVQNRLAIRVRFIHEAGMLKILYKVLKSQTLQVS